MKFFNRFAKPGKGVTKEEAERRFTFRHFFSLIRDRIWQIMLLNLLFLLVNLPLFGLLANVGRVGGEAFQTPVNPLYPVYQGVAAHGHGPSFFALHGVWGTQVEARYPTTLTQVFFYIGLLSILTFGIGHVAMTFVQRNFVKGEPTDLAPDFFGAIKRNWKQGILAGLIDLAFLFVILFDLSNYYYSAPGFGFLILFYITLFISIIYLLMRPFLYLQIVTFRIRIPKAIKNAYIMALAGIRRTLFTSLAAALVLALNVAVFVFLPSMGVVMTLMLTISLAWFLQIFGAWPVVKKYMIDPYYKESSPEKMSGEAVFTDRG